ncbi:proteasome inhibitor PI31 subunit [Microcaecilia unicolor]|uniref:Proteasome inhibitor PI31 subunit n=1 Tax=Microcaecilia unicolor TaxID=1415580 RepID=A0A6P7YVA9_9AMPH|nr:proteasome inhibitor PI31 subunit [Microcaecilia unicolor]XP_030067205.1 proteasome inhibitor PI31 subunit [Microcaecilia unicolor]
MAAGLELLYTSVAQSLSAPQDALLCFIHWEMVVHGYQCLGTGDKPGENDRKSEKLPAGWNSNKELYSLRYRSQDGTSHILLKSIMVENTMILNAMDPRLEQVVDVTLKVADYVNSDCLDSFEKVYKNSAELSALLLSRIISPFTGSKEKPRAMRESPQSHDPLRIPPYRPHTNPQPNWPDPLGPFAAGGTDLDPLGGRGGGGMIVDPLRSGFPRAGFNPSSGIPGHLPPGAVPPGARFDPFGPMSSSRPGPDPDHLPPPGYDDMFM